MMWLMEYFYERYSPCRWIYMTPDSVCSIVSCHSIGIDLLAPALVHCFFHKLLIKTCRYLVKSEIFIWCFPESSRTLIIDWIWILTNKVKETQTFFCMTATKIAIPSLIRLRIKIRKKHVHIIHLRPIIATIAEYAQTISVAIAIDNNTQNETSTCKSAWTKFTGVFFWLLLLIFWR